MASGDRGTGDQNQKRRGKAPVITLEATEVAPAAAEPVASEQSPTVDVGQGSAPLFGESEPVTLASEQPPTASSDAPVGDQPALDAPMVETAPVEEPRAAPRYEAASQAPEPISETPKAPETQSAGFGRLVVAGLIGALLTGGLAVGAQMAGFVPAANPPAHADVQARLAALDRAISDVAARPSPSSPTAPSDFAPLRQQIETSLAALEQRVKSLEDRPAAAPASSNGSSIAGPPPLDLGPINREIETLKSAVAALGRPAAPVVNPSLVDERVRTLLQPQADRIGVLDGRLQASQDDVKTLGDSLQVLGAKIAALETTRGQGDALGQKAALVVGLQLLRAAIDRGLPYGAELSATKALGADAAALQVLDAGAATGLATRAALATRFAALVPALQHAGTPAPEGSLMDRLSAGAQSLVRVRPVGETSGDDVGAIIGRVQAKLARGDVVGALGDIDRLPAAAKPHAREWVAEANARLAADATLQRMTVQALTALGAR
jgi:hypothetical protein